MLVALVSALALVVSSTPALQAAPSQPSLPPSSQVSQDSTLLPDIVVQGRSLHDEARAYVAEVGAPIPGATLARWHDALCVGVVNLNPELAAVVNERVRLEAQAVGVRVRPQPCRPNILVIATDSADATAQGLVKAEPGYFRPANGGTDLGPEALHRFETSDAAVRWWNVAMPVSNDTGRMAIALDAQAGESAPVIADRAVSRLQSTVRSDMAWAMVIVDVTRTGQTSASALGDYIAMLVLAQIDPNANMLGRDTILNLFATPGAIDAITDWDRAYLQALYNSPTGRPSAGRQGVDIARAMTIGRRADQDAPLDPAVASPVQSVP
ncbi:hypothetical protein BH10PSE2_BH10PSE2_09350 [soil metagenome]